MYAIVETGGKQYKVSQDEVINVEKLEAKVGDKVNLKVLLIAEGEKILTGAEVAKSECVAEVVEHGKDKKVVVFKYKAKKNERKKQGHRQPYTTVKIISVK